MPDLTPQLRRGLVALAAVLVFVGAVGAATIAKDDDKPDVVAGPGASTTLAEGSPGEAGGGSGSTLPGTEANGPGRGAPTTAGKGKSTAPTAGPPATAPVTADPGPAKAPAVGNYRFSVTDTDHEGTNTSERVDKVEAGDGSDGVTRRVTTREEEEATLRFTGSWAADGVRQERLFVTGSQGGQSAEFDCDWQPDVLVYAQPLSVGTKWTVDSSCETTAQTPQGPVPVKVRVQGERRVVDRAATTIGGTRVVVWVVEMTRTDTVTSGAQTIRTDKVTGLTHFEPTRGLDVYDKTSTVSSGFGASGNSTSERRLLSLNPS